MTPEQLSKEAKEIREFEKLMKKARRQYFDSCLSKPRFQVMPDKEPSLLQKLKQFFTRG